MIDSTSYERTSRQSVEKKARDQVLWRSRGGLTTRIHMLTEALGRPVKFLLTPGQRGDTAAAPALLEGQEGRAVPADKAHDSNTLWEMIGGMGAVAIIPSNRSRKGIIPPTRSTKGNATVSSDASTASRTLALRNTP